MRVCVVTCLGLLGAAACGGLALHAESDSDSGRASSPDAAAETESAVDSAVSVADDAACSWGHFPTQVTYTVGVQPGPVVVGDFNNDGHPDLVVANYLNDTIGVLLNAGDGTFAAQVTYPLDGYPLSVALGDFDGDGRPDVAVATADVSTVSILRNRGDGTFAPELTYAAGGSPRSLAVGDFNGDGTLDLAVVILASTMIDQPGVSLLLNEGTGAFAAPIPVAAGEWPTLVAAGDFDGDGSLDLAVTNGSPVAVAHIVDILLNDGSSMFAPPATFPVGNDSTSIIVAELKGGQLRDIAVTNYDDSTVSVLLNAGDGGVAPQTPYPTGAYPTAAAAGDFNGDGFNDLAVTSWNGSYVGILLNRGDGTFAAQITYATGNELSEPDSVAVGDFDGDGHVDLVVADANGDELSVLMNECR